MIIATLFRLTNSISELPSEVCSQTMTVYPIFAISEYSHGGHRSFFSAKDRFGHYIYHLDVNWVTILTVGIEVPRFVEIRGQRCLRYFDAA